MIKPSSISHKEYLKLLKIMTKQDRLITQVSVETGLRTSDVLRLRRYDIWSENKKYYIKKQERKTKKQKVSEISESLYVDLLRYYATHQIVLPTSPLYIFIHRNNPAYANTKKPIERTTYYKRLKRYAKETGIDVSPHSFRKLYAQNLYTTTHDIFQVQQAMNHKYTATTAGYLDIDINALILNALSTK